jgi:hypothetical protein
MREFREGTHTIRIDAAPQVLALDTDADAGPSESTHLAPSPNAWSSSGFVPAAVLAQKAKQVDDGIVAAVELSAESGHGSFRSKTSLLAGLLDDALAAGATEAAEVLAAAIELGGRRNAAPAPAADGAKRRISDFSADERRSKPLGFWTWTPALSAIFRQDRMLQSELKDEAAAARLLSPARRPAYDAWLTLVSRLTNPFENPDLRKPGRGTSILPPSASPEAALVRRLLGNSPVPAGFDLLRDLIAAVRNGSVSLRPRDDSGWYDRVLWSFETLAHPDAAPESARAVPSPGYRKHLEELFRAFLALARETHTKQLPGPLAGCGPPQDVIVRPFLRVEPLPTHYDRRADGYAFLRSALVESFGSIDELRRVQPDGRSGAPLAAEIATMESIYRSAAATSREDLGLPAGGDTKPFTAWADTRAKDADLSADGRMMVPLYYDVAKKVNVVLAFCGWCHRELEVTFRTPPKVEVRPGKGPAPAVKFQSSEYTLMYPVTVETPVRGILNRDEFRALCTKQGSLQKILEVLQP